MNKLLSLLFVFVLTVPFALAQTPVQEDAVAPTESSDNPTATIHTSVGDIQIELFQNEAPVSVANFIQYTDDGFYNGTIFHRVISYFMIQGGGMTPDMQAKTTRNPIVNEADNGLKNIRGSVAMARTNDADSATSQFYINVEVNAALDHVGTQDSRSWGYAVFGKVIAGMDVVDEIRFVETGANDAPVTPVVIESVELD